MSLKLFFVLIILLPFSSYNQTIKRGICLLDGYQTSEVTCYNYRKMQLQFELTHDFFELDSCYLVVMVSQSDKLLSPIYFTISSKINTAVIKENYTQKDSIGYVTIMNFSDKLPENNWKYIYPFDSDLRYFTFLDHYISFKNESEKFVHFYFVRVATESEKQKNPKYPYFIPFLNYVIPFKNQAIWTSGINNYRKNKENVKRVTECELNRNSFINTEVCDKSNPYFYFEKRVEKK